MTRELAPGVDPKMAGRRVGIVMFAIGAFMLALGALKIPRMGLGAEGLMTGWLVMAVARGGREEFSAAAPRRSRTTNSGRSRELGQHRENPYIASSVWGILVQNQFKHVN